MKTKTSGKLQMILSKRTTNFSPPQANHTIHHCQSQKIQLRNKKYNIDTFHLSLPEIQIHCSTNMIANTTTGIEISYSIDAEPKVPEVKESKYHLNILPEQIDNISQTHSPKTEFVEHSPGGSKKPNYLMKSIFLDKKSPSLSPSPSPEILNDKPQKSFSQFINGSPIQQYFLSSPRKDKYNYDTNERRNSEAFLNVDNELKGNDMNNRFNFKKKNSFNEYESDNSFNSGSNQFETPYTNDNSCNQNLNSNQNLMENNSSDLQLNDNNDNGKCSFNFMNINEINSHIKINDKDKLYIRQQQLENYKKRSVPLLNDQTQQYAIEQAKLLQQHKQFIHSLSLPGEHGANKFLNLGYKSMYQGNNNMLAQLNRMNKPHLASNFQSNSNLNNQSNQNQRLHIGQYHPMNTNTNPYQIPYNNSNTNNNSNSIPNTTPYNPVNQYLNMNQPPYPLQRNISKTLGMANNPTLPGMQTQPQSQSLNNQPSQYYQPNNPNSFLINNQLDEQNLNYQAYYCSKDQNGCRYLQKIVNDDPQMAIKTIYPTILEHLIELTTDQFGNYLIQKFLEYIDDLKLMQFMGIINPYICSIGLNSYGTRVIQKMMDRLTTDELINSFIIILSPAILQFIKDQNGNHIMLKLIQMPYMKFDFLFEVVNPNITDLSIHKIGCCFVQKCFIYIKGYWLTTLLDAIINNAGILVTNQYGNYVIQNLLLLKDVSRNMKIFDYIFGNVFFFAKHKYASNVIEKFLDYEYLKEPLIDLFANNDSMETLLLDDYGNYIIQKALLVATNEKKERLLYLIAPLLDKLKELNFGEKLYQKLIIQYPLLSNIMFTLKNSARMHKI